MTETQQDNAVKFGGALIFAVVIGLAIGINLDMPTDWTPAAIVCNAKGSNCETVLANSRHIVGSPFAWYGMQSAKLSDEAKAACEDGCFVATLFNQSDKCGPACDMHQVTPENRPSFEIKCKDAPFVGPCIHAKDGTYIRSASYLKE